MSVINKVLYPFILVGSLVGQEFRIVEDNWQWEIDKKAHYLSSFGLYYASYVLCEGLCIDSTHHNDDVALLVSLGIGLGTRYIKDTIGRNMVDSLNTI